MVKNNPKIGKNGDEPNLKFGHLVNMWQKISIIEIRPHLDSFMQKLPKIPDKWGDILFMFSIIEILTRFLSLFETIFISETEILANFRIFVDFVKQKFPKNEDTHGSILEFYPYLH